MIDSSRSPRDAGAPEPRPMHSDYMHWAKTRQRARFTLSLSGLAALAIDDLGATWGDLALEPPGGYGYAPLAGAIAARYGVAAECIVTAAGTSGANHLAMAALIEPGDEVLCESPVYEPMASLARHLGARLRLLPRRPEHGFRLDAREAVDAIGPDTRLVLLTNLHNPSSAPIDGATLEAIGARASAVGAKVLVDEVYLDAAFERAPPSAASLAGGPRHDGDTFLVTSSLTKVYGLSGLRAGWIVTSPPLARRMWRLKDLFGVNDGHPAERLSVVAFERLDALAARARRILDINRAAWHAFLDTHQDDLEVEALPFGTTSFPRVVHGDGDRLERLLRDRYETAVVPGRFFGVPDRVRIGVCGDPLEFPEALARLHDALADLREVLPS
ncbi:MAG: aminotransferase class I/II-fold pyridoxal phosphate-dependent enzyme [Vicinamibacteraceae bacterium]|nr:aminotransferase class I/II-fold pyridoxal phosphate-dependent enzyme [Vicinamibacteraceae bacterium]